MTAQAKKVTAKEVLAVKERELDALVNPRGAYSTGAGWVESQISNLRVTIKALRVLALCEEIGPDNIDDWVQFAHNEGRDKLRDSLASLSAILTNQGDA